MTSSGYWKIKFKKIAVRDTIFKIMLLLIKIAISKPFELNIEIMNKKMSLLIFQKMCLRIYSDKQIVNQAFAYLYQLRRMTLYILSDNRCQPNGVKAANCWLTKGDNSDTGPMLFYETLNHPKIFFTALSPFVSRQEPTI
jgi:hypothetical protein